MACFLYRNFFKKYIFHSAVPSYTMRLPPPLNPRTHVFGVWRVNMYSWFNYGSSLSLIPMNWMATIEALGSCTSIRPVHIYSIQVFGALGITDTKSSHQHSPQIRIIFTKAKQLYYDHLGRAKCVLINANSCAFLK